MSGNCGRRYCRCTHSDGCEYGWIDMPPLVRGKHAYERVAPCPVCRPESALRVYENKKARAA